MNEYRSVLVHASDRLRSTAVLRHAAMLSSEHAAALLAVHALRPLHLGCHLSVETSMIAEQTRHDEQSKRTAAARARVLEASQGIGIDIDFQHPGGDPVEVLVARAWAAGLLVMGQPSDADDDGVSWGLAAHVVVRGSCPVLFVPEMGHAETGTTNVLVAWSPTSHCARALRGALPLLQRAASVEVLYLGVPASGLEVQLDAVVVYLRRHGIAASCSTRALRTISREERLLVPSSADVAIASALVAHVAQTNAHLLVMGGFGHTRAYEFVLGGVSRNVLESMTLPELMSH